MRLLDESLGLSTSLSGVVGPCLGLLFETAPSVDVSTEGFCSEAEIKSDEIEAHNLCA